MDQIPDFVLKKAGNRVLPFLKILFNFSWKGAKIVPLLKLGSDLRLCGNYSLISLLSPFAILFESFIQVIKGGLYEIISPNLCLVYPRPMA